MWRPAWSAGRMPSGRPLVLARASGGQLVTGTYANPAVCPALRGPVTPSRIPCTALGFCSWAAITAPAVYDWWGRPSRWNPAAPGHRRPPHRSRPRPSMDRCPVHRVMEQPHPFGAGPGRARLRRGDQRRRQPLDHDTFDAGASVHSYSRSPAPAGSVVDGHSVHGGAELVRGRQCLQRLAAAFERIGQQLAEEDGATSAPHRRAALLRRGPPRGSALRRAPLPQGAEQPGQELPPVDEAA